MWNSSLLPLPPDTHTISRRPSPRDVFSSAGESSNIKIPASSIQCAVPSMDTFSIFYANMLLPALAPLFVVGVMMYDRTLGCTPHYKMVQMHPEQLAKLRSRSFTKGLDYGR